MAVSRWILGFLIIPRLHDDGTVRNGSAWHGTERLSSNVYTRLWLCGIEWFLKSNSVINYNHCQKSKWMPCLKPSVQSRKGGIRCTKEGERLFSRKHTQYYGNGHPIHLKWPQYRSCCTPIDYFSSFPVALASIPLPKSLSRVCFVQSTILILWKPVLRMLNCYHIPIDHNRVVPCRVARLLQPCWLGTVRHGFDRVYTSNFNRTVPCRAVAYRAGTEKLCRVNGVLEMYYIYGTLSVPTNEGAY